MKEINPRNRDIIVKSFSIAFAIVVMIAILRIAAKLLLLIIPIAVVVFIIFKIIESKN